VVVSQMKSLRTSAGCPLRSSGNKILWIHSPCNLLPHRKPQDHPFFLSLPV
jgi:hypothetical protein